MGFWIIAYTRQAVRSFHLPYSADGLFLLRMCAQDLRLPGDVTVPFRFSDGSWKILPAESFRMWAAGEGETFREARPLKNGEMFTLCLKEGTQVSLLIRERKAVLRAYRRYDLSGQDTVSIGRAPGNAVRYDCREMVSAVHAILVRDHGAWHFAAAGKNGSYLNGASAGEYTRLTYGDRIHLLGLDLVFLSEVLAVDPDGDARIQLPAVNSRTASAAAFRPSDGAVVTGKIVFHRSPRRILLNEPVNVQIDAPPASIKKKAPPLILTIGPSLTMVLPMLLGFLLMAYGSGKQGGGSGIWLYSGLVMAAASALTGAIWAMAGMRHQKRESYEEEAHRVHAYSAYLEEKSREIRKQNEQMTRRMRMLYPDTETLAGYDAGTKALWNRSPGQRDFLSVRLGTGDIPSPIPIDIPKKVFSLNKDALDEKPEQLKESCRMLHRVPILLDLCHCPVTGIIGGRDGQEAAEAARVIILQLAAAHCYTQVKLAFLCDRENFSAAKEWEMFRWLPHVWSEDKTMRYVASTKDGVREVCRALEKILRQRKDALKDVNDRKQVFLPYYVLFFSESTLVGEEFLSGCLPKTADQTNSAGFSVIVLSDAVRHLPNACTHIIQNNEEFRGMYPVTGKTEERTAIRFDRLGMREAEAFSGKLANIEAAGEERAEKLPDTLTFFEMYQVTKSTQLCAGRRWKENSTCDHIRALLGKKEDGTGCVLDIHEKYHGPHGLVAGTTGSGKSETLQTFLLSLALQYSPEDICFFIIDYKGGGMANLFDGLPHLAGTISNLSGRQVRRAMISIRSEILRRERIFGEQGVNHIDAYTRLRQSNKAFGPIPHLLIIIDEFAELKKEQPGFMRDLVRVAQTGRSLGVHLVLATQKPGGTVDDEIRSNARFRLCLRVQDRQDSMDMLCRPDAAFITRPGRGYLQVGDREVFELFQSGWSGAPCLAASGEKTGKAAVLLTLCGREDPACAHKTASGKRTQLKEVTQYLAKEAESGGYAHARLLWTQMLPGRFCIGDLPEFKSAAFSENGWKEPEGPWTLEVPVGLLDDPARQEQRPFTVSFSRGGHLAVAGSVVSGKSTFLQTLLYALVMKYPPGYISIYGLDFSSRMMTAFEKAPQVGGILCEGEEENAGRLFHMLEEMLSERRKLFRGGNYSQYVQVHGVILPAVLLVIDNISSFREKTDDCYEKTLVRLSKEGEACGIYLAVTTRGFGNSELPAAAADNFRTVIGMQLPDAYAYADIFHARKAELLPEEGICGRGLAEEDGSLLEFQTALAADEPDDFARMAHISHMAKHMALKCKVHKARKIPQIPGSPEWDTFAGCREVMETALSGALPVAYDERTAGIFSLPLRSFFCFLITGNVRTGRHNFLKVMVLSSRMLGGEIHIIDPGGDMEMLRSFEDLHFVKDEDSLYEFCAGTLTSLFAGRGAMKKRLEGEGAQEEELYEAAAKEKPVFVFISDMAWFVSAVYADGRGMAPFMEAVIKKGRFHHIFFAGCLALEDAGAVSGRALFTDFALYRTGVHFGGNVMQNPFMDFGSLSWQEQSAPHRPGRGFVLPMERESGADSGAVRIIVPLVKRNKICRGSEADCGLPLTTDK